MRPARLRWLAGGAPLALLALWAAATPSPEARAQAPASDPRAGGSRMAPVPEPAGPSGTRLTPKSRPARRKDSMFQGPDMHMA